MFKIGTVKLENWMVLAPMAGITNWPFRLMVKGLGAGLVFSEMVSAVGLALGNTRTYAYLKGHADEKPLAVQIFGSKPEPMAAAAEIAADSGADIVDINMGCPAKKVIRTGAGGALLRDIQRARAIVMAVRKACKAPLTVKIRAGWSHDKPVACDIARMIEDCGANAITIHPRFVKQGFSGKADWRLIAKVKQEIAIPCIGNGDVLTPPLAMDMRRQTGCDGVMIGRAAVGNPWIFRQALEIEKGLTPSTPDLLERKAFIIDHFRLLSSSIGEERAAKIMRGRLISYTKGLPHSSRYRSAVSRITDYETFAATVDECFSRQSMSHRVPSSLIVGAGKDSGDRQ